MDDFNNTFHRNINSSDTETATFSITNPFPTPEELGFSNPGHYFIQWNRAYDGTSNYYYPGQAQAVGSLSSHYYAIWGDTETTYTTTESEISSIADAIRLKGGTSSAITYPTGFVSAINNIPTGGNTDIEDGIITRAISGAYENSRVDYVGQYAFYWCDGLTGVSFPNAIRIGSYAFWACVGLTSIISTNFPNVLSIYDYAFAACSSLNEINFPVVSFIGPCAFSNCSNLTTVSFPSATNISASAFYSCSLLSTVNFPKVTTINQYAFAYCTNLTTVSFPKATILSSFAFASCTNLTNISCPSVTTIYSNAFQYCRNLTTVSFPKATKIGNYAFRYCYNLISLYLSGSSVVTLSGAAVFSSTPIGGYSTSAGRYGSVFVPTSLLTSYKAATYWSAINTRIVGY